MRSLVTGGLGFLGSHLVEQLAERGDDIIIVDNMISNVVGREFFRGKAVEFEMSTQRFVNTTALKFDNIYHLAAYVGPAGVIPYTGEIVHQVVDDSYAIARKAMLDNAKLVYVSTSEVYGGGQNKEEDWCSVSSVPSPRLEYAVGKLASEVMLRNLAEVQGLRVGIARPFNIAGPRQSEKGGFVIPRFIQAALKEKPITIFGDGLALRAFTHAKDIADGLILLMDAIDDLPKGSVFNLGNPESKTTITQLAHRVVDLVGKKGSVEYVDPTTIFGPTYVEAPDKLPDPFKAQTLLHWNPKRTFEQLLQEAVEWELSK